MVGDALELHENGGTNRYCDQGRRRQGVKKNKKLGLTLLLFVMNKVNIFPKSCFVTGGGLKVKCLQALF